jgi:Na+-driven multidrug efflux pump
LWLLGGAALASMIGVFLGYYAMTIYIRVHRSSRPRDDYFTNETTRHK